MHLWIGGVGNCVSAEFDGGAIKVNLVSQDEEDEKGKARP